MNTRQGQLELRVKNVESRIDNELETLRTRVSELESLMGDYEGRLLKLQDQFIRHSHSTADE